MPQESNMPKIISQINQHPSVGALVGYKPHFNDLRPSPLHPLWRRWQPRTASASKWFWESRGKLRPKNVPTDLGLAVIGWTLPHKRVKRVCFLPGIRLHSSKLNVGVNPRHVESNFSQSSDDQWMCLLFGTCLSCSPFWCIVWVQCYNDFGEPFKRTSWDAHGFTYGKVATVDYDGTSTA